MNSLEIMRDEEDEESSETGSSPPAHAGEEGEKESTPSLGDSKDVDATTSAP
jgi:hypothetical protein